MTHLPPEIDKLTEGRNFQLDRTGLSGSTVAIFEDFVLKIEPVSEESENAHAMHLWLNGKVSVPRILESVVEDGHRWTVMTRISGEMSCADTYRADPHRLTRILAEAMKTLWTVDVSSCPVDQSPAAKLARARTIVEAGEVNMELIDPETFGPDGFSSPAALLQWLEENALCNRRRNWLG